MLATMYSGGLRVSELTHLHYCDISRNNKSIHIRDSKSRNERYTLLADRTLDLLTQYWFKYDKPRNILFPSEHTGGYIRTDSLNQLIKKVRKKLESKRKFLFIVFVTALQAIFWSLDVISNIFSPF